MAQLTPDEIRERVFEQLKRYENLSSLEHFAMYMGKAQILEFGLKNLLVRLFSYKPEGIERWTLGRTRKELEKNDLRADYIALLKTIVDDRNYIAHEFLVNDAMLVNLVGDSGRLEFKHLERATYEIEQAIFLYDWTEEHNAWK